MNTKTNDTNIGINTMTQTQGEREQAMMNVTCPKLAKTLVKLQQVSNEYFEEYLRALNYGVIDRGDKMGDGFNEAFDRLQHEIAKLMTKLLQQDLCEAMPPTTANK